MSAGSLALDIFPRIIGLTATLQADAVAPAEAAGVQAGTGYSQAFSRSVTTGTSGVSAAMQSQLRAAQAAVEQSSVAISAARDKELAAADRVNIAETKLVETRAKNAAGTSQVVAAEARLEAAKRGEQTASERLVLAESNEGRAKEELIARNTALTASQERTAAASATSLAAAGESVAGMAAKFAKLAGIGELAIGVDAVHQAGNYQQALTKLATTAGESTNNLKLVGDGMLSMAGQVGVSAQDLAKSMYTVESAGFHGADALTVMKSAAQGAKQENADLGHVTDAVTTALHDYNLPATDAAKVTSQLVTAVSHGKTTFDELTGAMHSVTPIAAAAGISLAEASGALSAMTASGMSADQAAQNLGAAIKGLAAPTQPVIKEMAALGLSSVELSKNLGKTGVAGTLQEVSDAILQHMGPAGTTLLSTLNQSKLAGADAAKMYDSMAPPLRKVADELINGTITTRQFTTGTGHLDAALQGQGRSWLTQYKNATGFSAALKAGGNDTQTYMEALKRATGTTDGMAVALQVTGEHAGAVNAAIKDINAAVPQADGNIKGWDEVLKTFNLSMARVVDGIKSWVIELGQKLLPTATSFMNVLIDTGGWLGAHATLMKSIALTVGQLAAAYTAYAVVMKTVNLVTAAWKALMETSPAGRMAVVIGALSTAFLTLYNTNKTFHDFFQGAAIPAFNAGSAVLKTTATAVADVAKFFASLPGPVQAAVGALVAFRLATAVLGGTMTAATTSVTGFMRSIGDSTAFNTMGTAYLGASEKATMFARTQGTVAAASAGVRTGLSSVTSALGGPWGIAIAGATLLLTNWMNQNAKAKSAQDAAKASVESYTQAFKESHGVVDQSIKDKLALEATDNGLIASNTAFGISAKDTLSALAGQGDSADALRKKLQGVIESSGASGWKTLWNNLNDSDLAANGLRDGLNGTGQAAYDALKKFDAMSDAQKKGAAGAKLLSDALGQKLNPSTDAMKDAQSKLNDALQQGANKFQILNKGALDQSTASDALAKAENGLTDSVKQNGVVIDGNSTAALANRDAVKTAIQALSDKVQADYTANLSTMTLTEAQDRAKQETDQGKEALIRIAGQLGITGKAFDDLTGTIHAVPTQHDIDVTDNANAAAQRIDLLSSSIRDIPTQTKIAIDIAAGAAMALPEVRGYGPNADGNIYSAYANGGVENHIAQIAPKSGRGRLWAEDETGGEAYIPLAPGKRSRSMAIWQQTGQLLGAQHFVDGGLSDVTIDVTADLSAAQKAVKDAIARGAAASGGPPGSMPSGDLAGWEATALGILGKDYATFAGGLTSLIVAESGGNPLAQNNTDSNAAAGHPSKGLMQTIDGTFNAYALPGHGDIWNPVDNILAGFSYAEANYGDQMIIGGGRHTSGGSYLGYDLGGVASGAGLLRKDAIDPERVLSPRQTVAFEQLIPLLESRVPQSAEVADHGRGVTVNVYPPPGQSPEQIAGEVKRQLLFEMRRG